MKKIYVLKFILSPLNVAKMIKTKQKNNERCFDRVSVNMKNILYKQRAGMFLKLLAEQHPEKYIAVKRIFVRKIRRWKQNKLGKYRRNIVSSIFYTTVSRRIQFALGKIWLKTRVMETMLKWFHKDQN